MNEDFKNHMIKALNENVRADGRKKDEFREIAIETGILSTAEGSAKITCGETVIIVGVKLGVGTPYSDSPDQGVLSTGVELHPLSNPNFESGPPSNASIEIARVVDRGIRESGTIDTKKLCIEPGERVWMVNVDISPINMAGNLQDLGALAAIAALKDTKMPELVDGKPNYKKLSKQKLPISRIPVEVTVVKIGKNFLVDPTYEEEKFIDARLTVAVLEDDNLCAMQKGGDNPLKSDEIFEMIDIAIKKSKELRKLLK